jgi:hypothetical protein
MVSNAGHDEIFLETNIRELLKVATEADLIDIHRCGILYDEEFECLYSFV